MSQRGRQPPVSPEGTRLHRPHRDPQPGCDLRVREPVEVLRPDDLALVLGQQRDRAPDLPDVTHVLDGEPLGGVSAMGGVIDRYRRLTVQDRPVATGIAAVGDACACTNPSNGRGMTLGLMHVQRLRDTIRAHLEDPLAFARAWDAVTEAELTPWYRENVAEDRVRMGEIEALRRGLKPDHPRTSAAALRQALHAAVPRDPDVYRAFLASRACLTPLEESLSDPELVERIFELAEGAERPPLAGPDRTRLLELLDGGAAHPT
jgi:2-polyprenyl-6-methoxyphenol hydroxylase-like FAD-dependent oxidoreductase